MLRAHAKIARAQRLVKMLEDDGPLLALRVAELTPENQRAAKEFAAKLTACARAELEKLIDEASVWNGDDFTAEPAD